MIEEIVRDLVIFIFGISWGIFMLGFLIGDFGIRFGLHWWLFLISYFLLVFLSIKVFKFLYYKQGGELK